MSDADEVWHVDPHTAELSAVRRRVADVLDTGHPDLDVMYLVAVTEILTNAINAHQRLQNPSPIIVTIQHSPISISVVDDGDGIGGHWPPTLPHPDAHSGRGLVIARRICPQMMVQRDPHGTTVTIPYPTDKR